MASYSAFTACKLRLGAAAFALIAAAAPAQSILFDFDAVPQRQPLPLDVTQAGVTAHLSASGNGYSIQSAAMLGFTPAGFAGNAVCPSSVFPADLLIAFSVRVTDFSIAYAPEEYACDSSATLRVTAYLDRTQVGTATTTAPVPGTWPTGILAISVAQGFDNVVIHYDAPPPTGGDWGPIFMADNLTITVADVIFANGFE